MESSTTGTADLSSGRSKHETNPMKRKDIFPHSNCYGRIEDPDKNEALSGLHPKRNDQRRSNGAIE